MSPHTVRNHRDPRKPDIPADLIQKWQSSPRRAVRPQIRRPKTACERCRTAKVRCHGDGQHDCDRCSSRGLYCRYVPSGLSPSPSSKPTLTTSDPSRTAMLEEIGTEADFDASHTRELAGDDIDSLQHTYGTAAWADTSQPTEALEQQQQYVDWGTVDPSTILDLSGTFQGIHTPTSEQHQQPSLESLGLLPLITSTTANDFSWQDRLASQSCQCRAVLAQVIPNARTALRERRLDGAFRVTSDVIRRCEDIVGCGECSVNCTDLICIMAIFQEVDGCFECVAKGDIDDSLKVSMGAYEIEIGVNDEDAQEWRRLLVNRLVRRAGGLLDSISARGQDMLRQLDPGCRLGRVNINYLEAVIGNSRENLSQIMEELEESGVTEERN